MEATFETGFINDYVRYGVPLITIGVAYYSYRKGKLGAYLVSLIALTMWGLSAFMNAWTGYLMGGVISDPGAWFGATFMLITEFIVPASLIYKRITGHPLPMVVVASILMALGLSVFSFWNGTALSLNTHFAKMVKADTDNQSLKMEIAAAKATEQNYTVSKDESARPLEYELSQLKNQPAKNLAGVDTGRSIWAMTNNCTGGVYFTNPKLYGDECSRIVELQGRINRIYENNDAIASNVEGLVNTKKVQAELLSEVSDNQFKRNTAMPFIDVLVEQMTGGVKCEIENTVCNEKLATTVKTASSTVAFYISVFSELAKNALVFLAIGLLIPSKEKPRSVFSSIVVLLVGFANIPRRFMIWRNGLKMLEVKTKAEAHGQREAELRFESELRMQSRKEQVLLLEAVPWMQSIRYQQLQMVVDIDLMMRSKKAPKDEVIMLMVLVCREYSPNKQIPFHATLNEIKRKSREDKDYITSLMGEFNIPYEDIVNQVEQVTKLHRLSGIILPTLEMAGLATVKTGADNKNIYFWQSIESIETSFKKAIKRKQEIENNE